MNKRVSLKILLFSFIICSACERLLIEDDLNNDPLTNFNYVWETIDENYSFFEYKGINWDEIGESYRDSVYPGMSDYKLFDIIAHMLNELQDGHVNITSPFNVSRYWEWEKKNPKNFNWEIIENNYLGNDYLITGPLKNVIIDSVGYLYYGSFSNSISSANIDTLISRFQSLKGIIIDIRHNGGGSTSNGDKIISRLISEKTKVSYTRYKSGPGHNDFSDYIPSYISPQGMQRFPATKPVVLLTNRSSYSASTHFTLKMSTLGNVTIMGDTTGGGGGIPMYNELPNGWTFRYSSNITYTVNKFNVENGMPPDIPVLTNEFHARRKRDHIIDSAIDYIHHNSD